MRRLYWLCLAVVVYASLYPFRFVIPDIGDIDVAEIFSANSLGDATANVLAFGLIGVLARLAGGKDQRQTRLLVALAIALSAFAQFFQIFVPGRYPGLLDILMNLVGLTLGFGLAPAVATFLRRRADFRIEICGPVALLTALFLVGQLFPFFPALRLSGFKRNYWSMATVAEDVNWVAIAEYAVYWFVLVALFSPLARSRRMTALILLSPIGLFAARFLIIDNVANVWQLIGGCLGGCAVLLLQRSRHILSLAIILTATLIICEGLFPFTPRANPVQFFLAPFEGVSGGVFREGFPRIILKAYLYGSLIYLLWQVGFRKGPSTVAVTTLLLLIEIFQTYYASGSPELGGPLLAILSALVLARVPPLIIQSANDLDPG